MSERVTHECGVALVRLLKPLSYYQEKYGSPLWMYAGNRKVEFEEFKKRPKRVEHYHHPRFLMLNLLSLERMIKPSR